MKYFICIKTNVISKWLKICTLAFFVVCCAGNPQILEDEYISLEVLFINYNENEIHLSTNMGCLWYSTVQIKVVSGEYENMVLRFFIGEYPERKEFQMDDVFTIKILKNDFNEIILKNNNPDYFPFSSGLIIIMDKLQ